MISQWKNNELYLGENRVGEIRRSQWEDEYYDAYLLLPNSHGFKNQTESKDISALRTWLEEGVKAWLEGAKIDE